MKRIHKLLFGEGAGTYLPFALSRLKELERVKPKGIFSQTFVVDSATINVKQIGNDQYIRIWIDGGFYFEFATSGWPVVAKDLDSDTLGFAASQYSRLVVGTDVFTSNGVILTKPEVREQQRGDLTSRNWFLQQIQLINEPVRYTESDSGLRAKGLYSQKAYEAYAPLHTHTGFADRSILYRNAFATYQPNIPTRQGWQSRDVVEDYPTAWSHKFTRQKFAILRGNSDWWRAGGLRTVVDEQWGTRQFAFVSDAFGQISAFPTSEVSDNAGTDNVNYDAVQMSRPALPSWAWEATEKAIDSFTADPNIEHYLASQPDYEWVFNPEGTKVCVVPYARALFENDATYFAGDPDPDTPWRQEDFDRLRDRLGHGGVFLFESGVVPTYKPERYFYASGLVEYELIITLTGPNPKDFTFEIGAMTEHRNPTASDTRSVFAAGYAFMDSPGLGVEYGDLISVELESYSPTDWSALSTGYVYDDLLRLVRVESAIGTFDSYAWTSISFKNMSKDKAEAFCVRAHQILALDISTLSFVMKIVVNDPFHAVARPWSFGGGSFDGHRWTSEFGVGIFFNGELKEVLYPDKMPDSAKALVQAEVEKIRNSRAQLNAWLVANPSAALVPLNAPEDGWAGFSDARALFASSQLYWYNEPWVVDDPRADGTHGYFSEYPDGGWVKYTSKTYGSGWSTQRDLWIDHYRSDMHLMFCNNPKFGWTRYMKDTRDIMNLNPFTTFFTHPNGTYAFWCNHLLYDTKGIGNGTELSFNGVSAPAADLINDALDKETWEHCIFDRIHLQVTSPTGRAALKDTTFLDMYNQAVQAGLDAETLEENIQVMTKANLQGTFELSKVRLQYMSSYHYQLQIKFSWMGKDWYYIEPANAGEIEEPEVVYFPVSINGNTLGLQLDHVWLLSPPEPNYSATGSGTPCFPDLLNPSTIMARFVNPQIITG